MSGQTWTPAPKKGAIPLHPMTFGIILARSFSALRHNPRVIFGFAVAVQFAVSAVAALVALGMSLYATDRLSRVPSGSPDFWPIMVGTVALSVVVAAAVSLASLAFTVVVQGLVAADISFAALGRRAPLRELWGRVKPAFWRLFGFALLQALAMILGLALVGAVAAAVIVGSGYDQAGVLGGILLSILVLFAGIPLIIWLSIKLLVVPSILVLEGATIRTALVRSWRLIRGRFWNSFGVMFVIGVIMGFAAQVVGVPALLFSSLFTGVIAPTGDPTAAQIVQMIAAGALPQVLVLAVQAIALVVQATGATLIYLDSRMRYEALDQDLVRYVERRANGTPEEDLGDPYAVDPARAVSKARPPRAASAPYPQGHPYAQAYPYPQSSYPEGYPPAQGSYPQGAYPQAAYPHGASPQGAYPDAPGYPHPQGAPVAPAYPHASAGPYAPAAPTAQTPPAAHGYAPQPPSASPMPPQGEQAEHSEHIGKDAQAGQPSPPPHQGWTAPGGST